jgi:hypothetical protein
MSFIRPGTRLGFFATLLASSLAAADSHRIAVLDFDGDTTLAGAGQDAVVKELGRDNSLVPSRTWLEVKTSTSHTKYLGPAWWKTAARRAGVDALVEGWVQDEGRKKILTVVITDAHDGKELQELAIELPNGRWNEATQRMLRKGLEDRLAALTQAPPPDPSPRVYISGTEKTTAPPPPAQPATTTEPPVLGPQPAPEAPKPEPAPTAVATAKPTADLELKNPTWMPESGKHVPQATERYRVAFGAGWRSRSFVPSDEEGGSTPYTGVPDKFISVDAAFYPFPWKKLDGRLSGPGFHFAVDQSVGNTVTFDDGEEVGEYNIDQHGWSAGFHYRAPIGDYFAVDGELGYGRRTYTLDDAPETFEVPDTSYHYFQAGAHVDLSITERASVGFGGKYFHVLDSGDLTSVEWYGPGRTGGLSLDGNFVVPLPKKLFVRGDISYTKFKTTFDGVGVITEEEGAYEATDSTVSGSIKVGISF